MQFERLEEPLKQRRVVHCGRHQADRMLRAGGQGADAAGHLAGQVVEDHRLADIGSTHDRHDQQRLLVELRQELVAQQLEPLPSRRRGNADGNRHRLQFGQRTMQPFDFVGEGLVIAGHTASQGSDLVSDSCR